MTLAHKRNFWKVFIGRHSIATITLPNNRLLKFSMISHFPVPLAGLLNVGHDIGCIHVVVRYDGYVRPILE